MPPPEFMRLEDLLLPLPLPALLGVLMVLGLWRLGDLGAHYVWGHTADGVERGMSFVLVIALYAGLIHALALAQFIPLWLLRFLGWTLAALGIFQLWSLRDRPRVIWSQLTNLKLSRFENLGVALVLLTALGLLGAAIGPPTDADSLNYHLGVPLDWLRNGGGYPRYDWLHPRLVGISESLNLLGLGAGTDTLGAAIQMAGLVVAWIAVSSLAQTNSARLLAALLVMACPLILGLTPSQKPQLFPVAAMTLGLIAMVRDPNGPDRATLFAAFGCIGYAIANKYSFILTGAVAATAGLIVAYRYGRLRAAMTACTLALGIFALPVYWRNYQWYGDPLSPFLERFFADPDPGVAGFARYLHTVGFDWATRPLYELPMDVIMTVDPGKVSAVLGIGALAFLTIVRRSGTPRVLLVCALAATATVFLLGQFRARFLLEPYLWVAAAAAAPPWGRAKKVLQDVLIVQAVPVAGVALFLLWTLMPGAISQTLRSQVMGTAAYGYAEAKWLEKILPEDAVLITNMRSRALIPRRFVTVEALRYASVSENNPRKLMQLLEDQRVTMAMTYHPEDGSPLDYLTHCRGATLDEPRTFTRATRNPFNRSYTYGRTVYTLNMKTLKCRHPSRRVDVRPTFDPIRKKTLSLP